MKLFYKLNKSYNNCLTSSHVAESSEHILKQELKTKTEKKINKTYAYKHTDSVMKIKQNLCFISSENKIYLFEKDARVPRAHSRNDRKEYKITISGIVEELKENRREKRTLHFAEGERNDNE